MVEYFDVLLGGAIGITGPLILELWRMRKEEKHRREDIEQKRVEAAYEYFRGLYNAVQPFLKAYSQLTIGLTSLGLIEVAKKIYPEKYSDLDTSKVDLSGLINDLWSSMKDFMDGGYAALFPEKVFQSVFSLQIQLTVCSSILKDTRLSELNDEQKSKFQKLYDAAEELRANIRRSLNVDALVL